MFRHTFRVTSYLLKVTVKCVGTYSMYNEMCLTTYSNNIFFFKSFFVVSHQFWLGSDKWTMQERRQLNKALDKHHKDFFLVQKMVSIILCTQKFLNIKQNNLWVNFIYFSLHWQLCTVVHIICLVNRFIPFLSTFIKQDLQLYNC